MDADIHADAPLQYATIQILPAKHRYEAYICGDNKVEKLLTGVLDHLLPYMPSLKDLSSKGVNSNFKLQLPENLRGSRWFTKSTVKRFLDIVSSIELINATKAIVDEVAQLEEARKFHVSVYSQPEVDESSDSTRNELLRAIDSRLGALKGEFATAFSNAASGVYSASEISNLAMFSRQFGTTEMETALHEILKMSQKSSYSNTLSEKQPPSAHNLRNGNGLHSEIPIQYSVSPAKVAEVERRNLSGSDDSSGAEDQASAERSRASTRSASRRRSASPMRRVQIGRTGARKPAALAIRSLGYIPGRDKGFGQEEGEEGFENIDKKAELDLKRMSVQERIKIFESKQKLEQELEIEKKRSLVTSASFNKSVLRRWSAGMGESSNQTQQESEQNETEDSVSEKHDSVSSEVAVADEKQKALSQIDAETGIGFIESDADTVEFENKASNREDDVGVEETNEKMKNAAEWSRQKEAELNQMLMKMMESGKRGGKSGKTNTTQDPAVEQRGGFYDKYKQRRDEKLQGENAGKKAQKQAQFKAMQEILSVRKAEMASANTADAVKKQPAKKMIQKSTTKTQSSQPAKPRKETLSPAVAAPRKAASRTSPLPATRKSWPSTPPGPRTSTGISPAKTPTAGLSSAGTTPTRRRPTPPTSSISRPKPKVEKSQVVQKKSVVKEEANAKDSSSINSRKGWDNSKKAQTVSRIGSKTANPKVLKKSLDVLESKPSFYNKVTKKSSVVPLESKPMRKSPGTVPVVNKKKKKGDKVIDNEVASTERKKTVRKTEQVTVIQDSVGGSHDSGDETSVLFFDVVKADSQENDQPKCVEAETIATVAVEVENGIKDHKVETETALFPVQAEEEEEEEGPMISPMTWVEIEEHDHQELSNTPQDDDDQHVSEITPSSIIAPIVSSSPTRVRHSLSQMLQEETSEADISEWGNAENPPSMIFPKDAPKGLKRLLKFARKSKGDGNMSGWSSPSVYSEGEDDGEDFKVSSKRSTDNLLKALHAKNFGQQKFESSYDKHHDVYEQISANSGSQKFQEGQTSSTTPTTTKGSRSFFSLSAFRGGSSKPNETKFR